MKKCLILIFTVSFFSLTGCAWFFGAGSGFAAWSGDLRGTSWERTTFNNLWVKTTTQKKAKPSDPNHVNKEDLYLTASYEKLTISKTLNEAGYYTATFSTAPVIHTLPESLKDVETDYAEISYEKDSAAGDYLFNGKVEIDKSYKYEGFSKGIPCGNEEVIVYNLMITKDKIGQYFYHFYKKGEIIKSLYTNDGLKEETDRYTITDSSKFTYKTSKFFNDKTGETPEFILSPSKTLSAHYSQYHMYKKEKDEFLVLSDTNRTPFKRVKK